MRRMLVALLGACALLGCGRNPPTAEELAEAEARVLIGDLRTNASARVIQGSRAVRVLLKEIADRPRQLMLLAEWREALLGISVDGLRASDRCGAIIEACDLLGWSVVGAMWDLEFTYEDVWEHRFRVLAWLDGHVEKMRRLCLLDVTPTPGERSARWLYYRGLAEFREQLVENHERFDFDERDRMPGMGKMDEIRARFEKAIGRRVRRREEIKMLGFYIKQVRARIERERDEASKNAVTRPSAPPFGR